MFWFQVELTAKSTHCEALEHFLLSQGACSITFLEGDEQAIYEASTGCDDYWHVTRVHGLFSQDINIVKLKQHIQQSHLCKLQCVQKIQNQTWETMNKKHFKSLCFLNQLWIHPSWISPPSQGISLQLEPGLGFGTGEHPSTALCLEWLINQNLKNKTVIDYGCGSGILALASIRLGAKKAFGIDIDPKALDTSQQNAINNHINTQICEFLTPDKLPKEPVDIIVANILSEPLKQLAPTLMQFLKPKGLLVLSGLLIDHIPDIIEAYQAWVTFDKPVYRHEWVCLISKRDQENG
ncbi:MAG: 50S ribosomal protein L11 methyltransferase [Endozoicomonadaceae bacterium]|nr:50S ribosomal protein L11 methyltransferase [Endozoicomonadaceae bacterium]MBE8232251.1 50S ribosomal protein L11 methyltransferase [Endozoicomonadaceae bacterium]